ncbi:MAG: Vi polysaccharide biosynthesis protein VipA/TviB, partial [Rhodobacterales bacterium]
GVDSYDAIILAVPHEQFISGGAQALRAFLHPNGVLFDMKSVFEAKDSDLRL